MYIERYDICSGKLGRSNKSCKGRLNRKYLEIRFKYENVQLRSYYLHIPIIYFNLQYVL